MPERSAEIKRLILDRYDQRPKIKLQIVRDIENQTPVAETEAAKALQGDTLKTKICLSQNRAIVLGVDELDLEDEIVQGETTTEGRQYKSRDFQFTETTWTWIQIAKAVAIAFMAPEAVPAVMVVEAAWKAWDLVQNWWSGTPPA